MPDWTQSMTRSFEYYVVDPNTWKDTTPLRNVKSSSISWDREADTLGSATIDITESVGECYIRIYLITIQNGIREKHPLGTFLVQTPSSSFDGKIRSVSMDAYTPLLELKENPPPLGYSLREGANIMENAYFIAREHLRAPVVKTESEDVLYNDFVMNTDDTWLTFERDLIANAKRELGLDEMGRVLFLPKQDTASLQPVWTFNDDNSSILQPEITVKHDIFGIPNVVEVIYSDKFDDYYVRVVNDDPNSPTSTVNRGREITHRVTDLDLAGYPTKAQVQEYAEQLLRDLSSLECTVSFTHGYCPVRIGDCVRLNYVAAELEDVKARVITQSIKCDAECQVSTTAVYTKKLWR